MIDLSMFDPSKVRAIIEAKDTLIAELRAMVVKLQKPCSRCERDREDTEANRSSEDVGRPWGQ